MKYQIRITFLVFLLFRSTIYAQEKGDFQYTGNNLKSLRVPIGGIGTGDVLIGGRGNIEHIEVFNRPDRNRRLINTFFAIWVKPEGEEPVTKLLERELIPPYEGSSNQYASGLPRMGEAVFTNTYPLPTWKFMDDDIPLDVTLEAYNPFIPLDVEKSSYLNCSLQLED